MLYDASLGRYVLDLDVRITVTEEDVQRWVDEYGCDHDEAVRQIHTDTQEWVNGALDGAKWEGYTSLTVQATTHTPTGKQ